MSFTSPLGLMRHVRRPDLRMEVIPWLNVLVVGGMMYLLSSSYIWAPGLVVTNDIKTSLPQKLSLPTLTTPPGETVPSGHFDAALDIIIPSATLDTSTQGMEFGRFRFILDNGLYTDKADLARALVKLRHNLKGAKAVLLIKGDDLVPYGIVLQVCELASEAGFDSELWAVMPSPNGGNPASTSPAVAAPTASSASAPAAASGTTP